MMPQGNLPLQRLFTALQTAGLYIGPAERLRVQQLLADSQAEWRSTEGRAALMYELAPLLCRNRVEQEAFYKAYEAFLRELEEPVKEDISIGKKGFWELYWRIIAGALSVLVVLTIGRYFAEVAPLHTKKTVVDFEMSEPKGDVFFKTGDTIFFKNISTLKDTSKVDYVWTIKGLGKGKDEYFDVFKDTTYHLDYIAPVPSDGKLSTYICVLAAYDRSSGVLHGMREVPYSVIKYCNTAPRKPQDSIRVEGIFMVGQTIRLFPPKDIPKHLTKHWWVKDTILRDENPTYVLKQPGPLTIQFFLNDNTQSGTCNTRIEKEIFVGEDVPTLAALPLYKDTVKPLWNYTWLTKILALLAFLLAAWFAWRWWRRPGIVIPPPAPNIPDALRRAFEAEPNDKAPYSIPYRSNNSQIRMAAEQIELANTFRRRQEGQVATLNIPRTIGATMEKLGFTDLRFTYNTRPAHYLFLIDLQNDVSHQAQLFRYLVEMLEGQDVLADVFFYKNSLSRYWNRLHPEGLSLEQLALQYADRRLVVFGDGYRLLSEADEGQALHKEQADALRHWPRRMLVTPIPVASWTYREAWLYQLWAVFHADLSGMMQAARFVETGMDDENLPPTFAEWERLCQRNRIDADTDRDWDTPDEHRDYLREAGDLDGAMYRWLRALAVYPELNWNVTIAIGRSLGIDVRYEHLLALARIPWLQTGAMKPALWRAWMREMPLPDAAPDETLAREAVREELRAVEARCADGYADRKMQTRLAVQDFALTPADRAAQDHLYYVLQRMSPPPLLVEELDRVVERKVPGFSWTPGSGTGRALAYLQTGHPQPVVKRPFWTRDLLWCALCWPFFLLPLMVAPERWAGAYEQFPKAVGLLVMPQEDEAVRLNNLAVEAYYSSTMSDKFKYKLFEDIPGNNLLVRGTKYYVAFHQLNEAISIRGGNYELAETNRARIFFNNGLSLISLKYPSGDSPLGFKYPSGDSVAGKNDTSERLQNAIAHLRISQSSDFLRIPTAEAFTVAFYLNNQPDSACYWMNRLLTLKPDYDNWLEKRGVCKGGKCYTVVNVNKAVGFRNRILTIQELNRLDKNPNDPVGAQTLIQGINLGESVLVLDSTRDFWKVQYTGKIGYVAKTFHEKPTLQPCDAPCRPVAAFDVSISEGCSPFVVEVLNRSENANSFQWLFSDGSQPFSVKFNNAVTHEFTKPGVYTITLIASRDGICFDTLTMANTVTVRTCDPTPPPNIDAVIADIEKNMVFIKGGTFRMGSDEKDKDAFSSEKPAHDVTLKDYYMGRTEVTIGQYLAFCDETKTHYPEWLEAGNDYNVETGSNDYYKKVGMSRDNKNHPVTGVSWNDAVAYCQWISRKTGRKYRLPTEAEWEYAARGGPKWPDGYAYSGGDDLNGLGWYNDNSNSQTHPVAGKNANQLGLYDMSGNVWEWCNDWYDENYYEKFRTSPAVNPQGADKGEYRVDRGCGWDYGARYCRAAYRDGGTPTRRNNGIGFRLSLQ